MVDSGGAAPLARWMPEVPAAPAPTPMMLGRSPVAIERIDGDLLARHVMALAPGHSGGIVDGCVLSGDVIDGPARIAPMGLM